MKESIFSMVEKKKREKVFKSDAFAMENAMFARLLVVGRKVKEREREKNEKKLRRKKIRSRNTTK